MTLTSVQQSEILNVNRARQFCTACKSGQYVIDPDQNACSECPAGAICADGAFFGLPAGAVWLAAGDFMRLEACPAGYVLVRDEARPAADECVACPASKYLVGNSSAAAGRLVVTSAAAAPGLCLECVAGAVCRGGAEVVAQAGYWVAADPAAIAAERRAGVPGQQQLTALQCAQLPILGLAVKACKLACCVPAG